MGRNLVIVCAGDQSLHQRFADSRNFDIWVIYYGQSDAVFEDYRRTADRSFRLRGLKWALLRSLIDLHLAGEKSPFDAYRYIFLPDDDLDFPNGATDIQRLFDAMVLSNADIGQPAIANQYFSWQATRLIRGALCHATNIVELMSPVYSVEVFQKFVLPCTAALDFLRAGWGIEVVIAKAAEVGMRRPARTFVFDSVPMIHTRPVGQGGTPHRIGDNEALMMPGIFANRMATYASFRSYERARAFAFPFVRDATDHGVIELAMRRVSENSAGTRGIAERDAMLASTSWRITAPLRALSRLVRKT
jgi:hypothetical protein